MVELLTAPVAPSLVHDCSIRLLELRSPVAAPNACTYESTITDAFGEAYDGKQESTVKESR